MSSARQAIAGKRSNMPSVRNAVVQGIDLRRKELYFSRQIEHAGRRLTAMQGKRAARDEQALTSQQNA